jgi:hypothetical protein
VDWRPGVTAGRAQGVLTPDMVDALFAEAADLASLDPRRGPLPAVLSRASRHVVCDLEMTPCCQS